MYCNTLNKENVQSADWIKFIGLTLDKNINLICKRLSSSVYTLGGF